MTGHSVPDNLMAETAATLARVAKLRDELFRLAGQLWVLADRSGQYDLYEPAAVANDAGLQIDRLQCCVREVVRDVTVTLPIRSIDGRETDAGSATGPCCGGAPLDDAAPDGQ